MHHVTSGMTQIRTILSSRHNYVTKLGEDHYDYYFIIKERTP